MFMETLTIGQLKTNFSDVIKSIKTGKEVIIAFGKKKEKIAVIIPYKKYVKSKKIKLGLLESKASYTVKDDFKISDKEFLTL